MIYQPLLSHKCSQQTLKQIDDLLLPRYAYNLVKHCGFTNIGQWAFSHDELEVLTLYIREGQVDKFKENCLVLYNNEYLNKGNHYFKDYNKRYGPKQYQAFVETLCQLITRIVAVDFEEEDKDLQLKVLLTVSEELLNHFAWGIYLAYQAAGVRKDFTANISPQEIMSLQQVFLMSAEIYCQLVTTGQVDVENCISQLPLKLSRGGSYKFISNLATKGTRDTDGTFFRERLGCRELANMLHALLLKSHCQEQKINIEAVVAPYYDGLTAAALAYTALRPLNESMQFFIHVYNSYDDYTKTNTWQGKNKREILNHISSIPVLVRPEQNMAGKTVLIADSIWGEVVEGLENYHHKLGATVYLSIVEGQREQQNLLTTPIFESINLANIRQFVKHIKR